MVFKFIGDSSDGVFVVDFELVDVGAACDCDFDFSGVLMMTVIVSFIFDEIDDFGEKGESVFDEDEVMILVTLFYVRDHFSHQS